MYLLKKITTAIYKDVNKDGAEFVWLVFGEIIESEAWISRARPRGNYYTGSEK
jgi:hypothetical protein